MTHFINTTLLLFSVAKTNISLTVDKKEVFLLDPVTMYFKVESSVATSNHTLVTEGAYQYSCPLSLKTIQNHTTGHTYLCSTFKLQATAVGTYSVILQTSKGQSEEVHFTVNFPNSVMYRCLKYVEILGTEWSVYSIYDDIELRLSGIDKGCGNFKITKYLWTFSFFDSVDKTCISNENFKMAFSLFSTIGYVRIWEGEIHNYGHYKVCIIVTGISEGTVFKKIPVTCVSIYLNFILYFPKLPPLRALICINSRWPPCQNSMYSKLFMNR